MSVPSSQRAGLVLLGLLSVADLALPFATDGETPPMAVALVAAGLGLVSLVLVVAAWRGSSGAVVPLVGLRALSAVLAVPAFFGGVPTAAVAVAAVTVLITLAGAGLLLRSRPVLAGAR